MKRGHKAAAGRLSLFAAASIFLGGYAVTPATAADLGGDCCADLEERVAELEATTVRKGKRQLSMTISGRVHSAVMYWNDGGGDTTIWGEDDLEVGPPLANSRFRLDGRAKLREGWEAGYRFAFEFVEQGGRGFQMGHADDDNNGNFARSTLDLLDPHEAYWFVRSARFGAISVGQRGQTYDGASKVDISGHVGLVANVDPRLYGGRVRARTTGGTSINVIRRNYFQVDDGDDGATEEDGVRYDSPNWGGFILSADWTNNASATFNGRNFDTYGIRLSFARQMERFKVAAAVAAYQDDWIGTVPVSNPERTGVLGSIGVMDTATGLFFNTGAGTVDYDTGNVGDDDPWMWYITLGLQRKWSDRGPTTIYAQYYTTENNSICGGGFQANCISGSGSPIGNATFVDENDGEYWGFGVVQTFDAAAMDIYVGFRQYIQDFNPTLGIELKDQEVFLVGGIVNF